MNSGTAPDREAPVSGYCDPSFHAVRDAFAENFASRGEVGAGVCVIIDGAVVVDLVTRRSRRSGPSSPRPARKERPYGTSCAIVPGYPPSENG